MFCPKCGCQVIDNARFCPKCGFALYTLSSANNSVQNSSNAANATGGNSNIVSSSKSNIVGRHSSPQYDTSIELISDETNGLPSTKTNISSNAVVPAKGASSINFNNPQSRFPDAIMMVHGADYLELYVFEEKMIIVETGRSTAEEPISYQEIRALNFSKNSFGGVSLDFLTDGTQQIGKIQGIALSFLNGFTGGASSQRQPNIEITVESKYYNEAQAAFKYISARVEEAKTGNKHFSSDFVKMKPVPGEKALTVGMVRDMNKVSDTQVVLNADALTMHTFVTGSTGSGKSNTVYEILAQVEERNKRLTDQEPVSFLVIEPAKGEYRYQFPNAAVYGTNQKFSNLLRINPFSFPDGIHVLEHIDRLCEIFNACWPMEAAMPAVLKESIEKAYIKAGWDTQNSECTFMGRDMKLFPSFPDVLDQINVVLSSSAFSAENKGNYVGALSTRMRSLTTGIYREIFTCDELSDEDLFAENTIVDLSRVGSQDTKSLLMGLLIMKLQEYRMSERANGLIENNSGLRHLTVIEEAHNLLKASTGMGGSSLQEMSVQMLSNIIAEMRTYGEGFVIADQAPGLLDLSVIRNTNTKLIHRLPNQDDRILVGKAAALSDAQIEDLAHLQTGVAAIYQNDWKQPVLCQVNKAPEPEQKTDSYVDDVEDVTNFNEYVLIEAVMDEKDEDIDWNEVVERTHYRVKVKTDILRFVNRTFKNDEEKDKAAIKMTGELFNTMDAIDLSKEYEEDADEWTFNMIRFLYPSINDFDEKAQKIILLRLALYAYKLNHDEKLVGLAESL